MFYRRPSWKDGTTATTIIIINDTVYCANIGDSKVCFAYCFLFLYFIHFFVFFH